jgi:hypothetical protein
VPKICSQLHAPKGSKEGSKIGLMRAGSGALDPFRISRGTSVLVRPVFCLALLHQLPMLACHRMRLKPLPADFATACVTSVASTTVRLELARTSASRDKDVGRRGSHNGGLTPKLGPHSAHHVHAGREACIMPNGSGPLLASHSGPLER